MPAITVVIATYNRGARLLPTLGALAAQTCTDFEAWVVGDACTDDTEAVVAAFDDPRVRWTNLPVRTGSQAAPNNEGVRLAASDLIAYLGHDDLWFPRHLETLRATIMREPAEFAYAGGIAIGPEGPREAFGGAYVPECVLAPPSAWMHRRSLVERLDGWRDDANGPIGCDEDFDRRARAGGARYATTGQITVLKFPAPWWRAYAGDAPCPQASYRQHMLDDADELLRQTTASLLFTYSAAHRRPGARAAVRAAARALGQDLRDRYGADRWPVASYLRWRRRRRRDRLRAARGLANHTPK